MNNSIKKQGSVLAKKLFGVWMLFAACVGMGTVQAQTVEYFHTDGLGTPVAVTDANRNVIERSEYEPYGALLNRPISDGPGYTGHLMDAATGLTYMQQRYYDPQLGRFLSVDPVTADSNTGGNFNRYYYANSNPYKFTDPDGRLAFLLPLVPPVIALGKAAVFVGTAAVAAWAGSEAINAYNESAEPDAAGSNDRPTGEGIKFDDKIEGQLGDRGWTQEGVRELTKTEPAGTSIDNTGGRRESATVYGTKDGGHVVVNDKSGNVTQVSDKNDSAWKPDRRIEWKKDQK